jgi:DNA-3-methyladenine glycosylase I
MAEIPVRSPESAALSAALRAHGYVFTGPVAMFALMESAGIIDTHLLGSHRRGTSGIWPGP